MKFHLRYIVAALSLLTAAPAFAAGPMIFYSDLDSGPATGGENNLGVFVTINGQGFGAAQGGSAITLGGGAVTVKSWSDRRIVFQPGPGGRTGDIVVTVGGSPSQCAEAGNCTFTVRPGGIYCISNNGDNTRNGKFTSEPGGDGCWRGLDYSIKKLNPGDTLFFGANAADTFQQEPDDLLCASMSRANIWVVPTYSCGKLGTAGKPIAIAGYPGNSATIGGTDGNHYAMSAIQVDPGSGGPGAYWTVANLNLVGSTYFQSNGLVLQTSGKYFRFINLDIELPLAPQSYEGGYEAANTGAVEGEGIVVRAYGLYIHNINVGGTPGDVTTPEYSEASKHSAMIYQGADGNEQEIAWSVIDGTPQPGLGGINRCYHNHSSPGTGPGNPIWGVHLHDNVFTGCSGNTFDATIDPGKGTGVEFYNNLIYHTGTCENWVGSSYGYSTFLLQFGTIGDYNWQPATGVVKFYNNTVYDINANNCPSGIPMKDGLFIGPAPGDSNYRSTGYSQPPPDSVVCASNCTARHYSGTLPATAYTPYYFPNGVAFQTVTGSSNGPETENIADDGNGHLTQEGQVVGSINYATGAYDFTFLRTPPAGCTVTYFSIHSYRVDLKNNIFYLKSGEPVFWDYSGGQQIFQMDHNLFFHESGTGPGWQPTWPIPVTNPVGSNSNPGFKDPAHGDFSFDSTSPAYGAGANTGLCQNSGGGWNLGACTQLAPYVFTPGPHPGPGTPGTGPGTGPTTTVEPAPVNIRVYPNPWRNDKHGDKSIVFDGLVAGTTVKIFTLAGHKVAELHGDGPKLAWDLKTKSGDAAASGIYLYLVTDAKGDKVRGKLAIVK